MSSAPRSYFRPSLTHAIYGSEAEAVSVEAALAEDWAEAVVPVLVSKINVIQCPSFEIN